MGLYKKVVISLTILVIVIQLMIVNYFQDNNGTFKSISSSTQVNGNMLNKILTSGPPLLMEIPKTKSTYQKTTRNVYSSDYLLDINQIISSSVGIKRNSMVSKKKLPIFNSSVKSYRNVTATSWSSENTNTRPLNSRKSKIMKKELEQMSLNQIHKKIWDQIETLQERGNCKDKKILHCEPNNFAGFGSMLSKYSACIQVAFALGRMFFIHQPEYEHFGGLSQWLLPESKNCYHLKRRISLYEDKCSFHDPKCFNGFDVNNKYKVLIYNKIGYPGPRRIPGTIPKDIEDVLRSFNVEDPKMWFTSQFLGYLVLRLNSKYMKFYQNIKRNLNLQYPYVAMHVRQGDKLDWEAKYIPEQIFTDKAQDYFNRNFPNLNKPNIFLATDNEDVPEYISSLLPESYQLMMLPKGYRARGFSAYTTYKNFPKEVIGTMLMDLYFLVYSNFTVCTFSSNVGRMVYLLKQAINPSYNISKFIISLDRSFHHDFFGFSYELMGATYYLSITENTHTLQVDELYFLLKYKPGELFRVARERFSSDNMLLVERNWWTDNKELGLVYTKDMQEWLNYPSYFFYQ